MSKYMRIQTQFKDEAIFQEALGAVCEEMGIIFETHDQPTTLLGWSGRREGQKAHYVIPRHYLGYGSMGFRREDEEIVAIVDDYDNHEGGKGRKILNGVKREYARGKVTQLAQRRGLEVEEIHENGAVRLRLVPKRGRRSERRVRVRR